MDTGKCIIYNHTSFNKVVHHTIMVVVLVEIAVFTIKQVSVSPTIKYIELIDHLLIIN